MNKEKIYTMLKECALLTPVERAYLAKKLMELIIEEIENKQVFVGTHDKSIHITKKDAARLLSVCPSTIDNAARAGKLKRHYVGKSVRFERDQVLALRSDKIYWS
jgi:excisionase family DNA binding protein